MVKLELPNILYPVFPAPDFFNREFNTLITTKKKTLNGGISVVLLNGKPSSLLGK